MVRMTQQELEDGLYLVDNAVQPVSVFSLLHREWHIRGCLTGILRFIYLNLIKRKKQQECTKKSFSFVCRWWIIMRTQEMLVRWTKSLRMLELA